MLMRHSILLFPIKLTIHVPVWMFLMEETIVPQKDEFLRLSQPQ